MARRRIAGLLALSAFAASALAVAARADDFPSLRGERFADVRVDVRPLLALGAGAQAEALRADLTAALRSRFAGRLGGRGPSLVVLVRGFSLRPYAGGGTNGRSGFGGGSQNDYLDGEALLVARDGAVLGRHPQLTATPSSFGGAWYDPQSERRRVTAIADIYADWLVRNLPAD
ncbi:hypothetical protein [Methylobacterium sp. WL120]|uniref:hypothetical protein n=1 Tax=Methylobacterium sp. WL120 TaxID=2603887 RepID=UPI0011C9C97C|nr:hypothetical protein [Methylobacterium sp. WL120]TXM70557.1 hypothetical protein FV229_02110 [Methylobacterium sp. WL120]